MSDIVERLEVGILSRSHGDLARTARDEIVWLREENERLKQAVVAFESRCNQHRLFAEAAGAERDRLRAALRKIDDTLTNMQPVIANGLLNREQLGYVDRYVDPAIKTARAALNPVAPTTVAPLRDDPKV